MSPDVEEVEEKLEGTPYDAIEVLDDDSRRFVAWASVEVVDREGEVIPMSELRKIMPQIMERGGPIQDSHSNRNIGRILNYSFAEKEVDGEMKDGLLILAKIYDHTDLDDKVWSEMKEGDRKGISFGGAADDAQLDVRFDGESDVDILRQMEGYEFSSVHEPANQEANNVAVNPLAKAETTKAVMKSLDLEYTGEDYLEKASKLIGTPEPVLIDFVKSLDKGVVESVFGENVTPANVVRFLLGDVDLEKGDPVDYQFETEEEAQNVADQLGLEGVHEHTIDGETVYMPGEDMDAFDERMRELRGVVRAERDYDSVSDCMSHKVGELGYDQDQAFAMCTSMVKDEDNLDKLLSKGDSSNSVRSDNMSESNNEGEGISSEKLLESFAEKHGVDTEKVASAVNEWKEKDDAENGVVDYLSNKFEENEKSEEESEDSDKGEQYDDEEDEDKEDGDMNPEEMVEMLEEYIDSKMEGVEAGKGEGMDDEEDEDKEDSDEENTMEDKDLEKALNKAVNEDLDLDSKIEKQLEEKLKTSETPRPGQSENDGTDVSKGQDDDPEENLIKGLVRKNKQLSRKDKIKMEKARRGSSGQGLTIRG